MVPAAEVDDGGAAETGEQVAAAGPEGVTTVPRGGMTNAKPSPKQSARRGRTACGGRILVRVTLRGRTRYLGG